MSEDHCNSPTIDLGALPRKTLKNNLRSQDNLLGQYSPLRADFADKVRKLCIQEIDNDVPDDERITSNWKKRGSLGRQRSSLSQQSHREKRLGVAAQDLEINVDKPSLTVKTR